MTRRLRGPLLVAAVWLGVALVFVVQRVAGDLTRTGTIRWVPSVGLELVYWLPWLGLAPILLRLARRFPFTAEEWRRSLAGHLVGGTAVAVLEAAGSTAAQLAAVRWLWPDAGAPSETPRSIAATITVYTIVALWKYWAFVGIANAFLAARRSRERALAAARLEGELTRARLQALEGRLHPHFLFNALNAASMLTLVDAEAAHRLIAKLADYLRGGLREAPAEIPLAEELATVDRYLEIERIRFEDRLAVAVDADPETLTARVPTLLLQPLVENAIRHGVAPVSTAGRVAIRSRRRGDTLVVEIEDDGPGPAPGWERSSGLGLSTTRARLGLLYPGRHGLDLAAAPAGGCRAVVTLPFRA